MTIKKIIPEPQDGMERLDQWLSKREEIKSRFLDHIGKPNFSRKPHDIETIETVECDRYTRNKLHYQVGDKDEVRAYLFVPHSITTPAPAILAMHQMNNYGKDEVAGLFGNKDYAYGHELAERGYTVFAPDYLCMGERVYPGKERFDSLPFYEKYPSWSMVGKDIEDSMSAIDVLCSLDYVNPIKIGVIGHSHGGSNAIFAMAMDERIAVGVSNCGMSVISEEEKCLEWSTEDGYIYFPKLRRYLLAGEALPFDINEVAALIAPRPWLNISAYYDKTLGNQEFLAEVSVQLNQVYKLYGKQKAFAFFMHGNDHSFPKFARTLAYEWLDRFLKPQV
jgi:dienelactone hydrolase